jgi:polyisoprenoid-binding protein YceI
MISLALLTAVSASSLAQPRDSIRADASPGSRVWIEGSSNVTDWACKATTFEARVELDPSAAQPDVPVVDRIRRVSVKVSARDLKCGNRKMERDLYSALKANDPANPSYIVAGFNSVARTGADDIETQGLLTVVGVDKYIDARITTERLPDGTVKARGSVPLRMTDFGVKPPVGLFGLIRSKDEFVVKFELVIGARALPE